MRRQLSFLPGLILVSLVACVGGETVEDDDSGASSGTAGAASGGSNGSGGATTGPGAGGGVTSSGAGAGSTSSGTGVGGSSCTPDCSQTECGPDPVCNTDCGSCSGQDVCQAGQCQCQGSCVGKTCGDDGCGNSCGSCSGQDACQGGQCVCQPACNGKQCGPDGCGGSCGTCTTGSCMAGQCVTQCTTGQSQCTSLSNVNTCVNGLWQSGTCPSYQVCVQGGCEPVCDGYLATQTNPSVCYFPVKEGNNNGLFVYTNSSNLPLNTHVNGAVWDGQSNTPIYSASGTSWPWAWTMLGLSPADVAAAQFKLSFLAPPVNNVYIHWRSRRTGGLQTSYPTRYNVSASNGSIFASATPYANYSWTTHSVNTGSLTSSFSPSAWNFMMISPIGDGFGHIPDEIELSWFMLEVVP